MADQDQVLKQEIFDFLEDLKESGVINMWGAAPNIQEAFPQLSLKEAKQWLRKWISQY